MFCFFFKPDDEIIREVDLILFFLLCKIHFSFINHFSSLFVIITFFLLDDFAMGFGDDCNDEIHKDHEQEELSDNVYDECEDYDALI